MNRGELLEHICPNNNIDICCSEMGKIACKECDTVLNTYLDEYDKQIRADAIDDFAKKLKSKCRKCYVDCDPYGSGIEEDSILYEDEIYEIAEELKAGGKNEQRRIS